MSAKGRAAIHHPARGNVDAHVHVFPPEVIRDRTAFLQRDDWFSTLYSDPEARMATADEVLAEMDECDIATAVIFGFAFADQGLCRLVNDYVIEAVAAHPGRLAGMGCVAPESRGAVAEADRCLDEGLLGCGELVPREGFGHGWHELGRRLAERGAPLLIHANEPVGHEYPGKGDFPLEDCVEYVAAHPDLTVVLAHMGGGLLFYELMPELRKTLARVYYDTAAVPYLYEAGVYPASLAAVGGEKLLFGSDYPLLAPSRYVDALAALSPPDQQAILGDNARRVYGI